MKFFVFLTFSVWMAFVTCFTFGKGELQISNHILSLDPYFIRAFLLHLSFNFCFADSSQFMQWACILNVKIKIYRTKNPREGK